MNIFKITEKSYFYSHVLQKNIMVYHYYKTIVRIFIFTIKGDKRSKADSIVLPKNQFYKHEKQQNKKASHFGYERDINSYYFLYTSFY